MPNDDMFYHFELTYDIRVAKWRINDPDEEEVWFSLEMWDENLGYYVKLKDCTRPGEHAEIKSIKKIKKC
jgi:hypothetical protein